MASQVGRIPMPPAIRGRGPTLATCHEVERIMREAEEPLSLNEIKRRMAARAVRHAALRQVINEFVRLGLAVEGSKGVLWTLNLSGEAWTRGRAHRI